MGTGASLRVPFSFSVVLQKQLLMRYVADFWFFYYTLHFPSFYSCWCGPLVLQLFLFLYLFNDEHLHFYATRFAAKEISHRFK
jgi:hypothetical protein